MSISKEDPEFCSCNQEDLALEFRELRVYSNDSSEGSTTSYEPKLIEE
jgi:hypothetical protein